MNTRFSQISFSRGELSPALYNRNDIKYYSIGLKTLKNAFIHQEGCVSNRHGLRFVGETLYSDKNTRLIAFTFNTKQTYIIEAGDKYFRFIQKGGYIIVENATAWITATSYKKGNYVSVGNETYYCLSDHTSGTFITDLQNGKWIQQEIYEIPTPYAAGDLQTLKFAQSGDVLTIVHHNYSPMELSRYNHTDWRLTPITTSASINPPSNVSASWTGSSSQNSRWYKYRVTAIDSTTLEESKGSAMAKAKGHREASWTTSEYMTISWSAVTNALEYNVYRNVNGIYAYIGTSTGTSFVDECIEPDMTDTIPEMKEPFKNNNPSCCCYFQQRKIYANTQNNPQTIYTSQTATSNNFNTSRPIVATDAIEIPLADREVNEIMHLVPFKDLIALTTNSEYKINGSDGVLSANPMPVSVIQSCYGSNHVQPIISGDMVIFVEAGGKALRDLGYDYLSDGYTGDELSLFANHLFLGKEIIYIAFAKIPYRLIYVVLNDGTMLVLTYNRKQEICGWSRYETDGKIKSVAVVREDNEDVAYVVAERIFNPDYEGIFEATGYEYINNEFIYSYRINNKTYYSADKELAAGSLISLSEQLTDTLTVTSVLNNKLTIGGTTKTYVECTATRIIKNAKTGFLVDSGFQYHFDTPYKTVSADDLTHLVGRKVVVLADGGVIENVPVTLNDDNIGTISIDRETTDFVVGLPYEFEMETLGIEGDNTHGLKKLINSVTVSVLDSREDFFICGNKGYETQFPRSYKSTNDSGYLFSGAKEAVPLNTPTDKATIHIKQKYPLPITVSAVSAMVNVADIQDSQ